MTRFRTELALRPSEPHLPTKTWQDATSDLMKAVFGHEHYRYLD